MRALQPFIKYTFSKQIHNLCLYSTTMCLVNTARTCNYRHYMDLFYSLYYRPVCLSVSSSNNRDRSMNIFYIHPQYKYFSSVTSYNIMNVFDRQTKRKQRNYTAKIDHETYDYLKEEVCYLYINCM